MQKFESKRHSKVKCKTLSTLIPDTLSQIKVNKPLIMQLDIVFQCVKDFEKLVNSKEVMKSLSDDITPTDFTRWVMPNYRNVITILSLEKRIDDRDNLKILRNCFQLLLASYCCFKIKDPPRYIVDGFLSKAIRNDILTNKTKNSKLLNQLYLRKGISVNKTELLKSYCKLITLILRLKLKVALPASGETSDTDATDFFHIIGSICSYLESLIHAFIAQYSSKNDITFDKQLAFNQHYVERTRVFSQQHVNDLLLMLSKESEPVSDKENCLKMVIKHLLKIFDDIEWSQMDTYVEQHKIHACTMRKRRLNIQSTLLVSRDLDLISEFRLINWPAWAKSS